MQNSPARQPLSHFGRVRVPPNRCAGRDHSATIRTRRIRIEGFIGIAALQRRKASSDTPICSDWTSTPVASVQRYGCLNASAHIAETSGLASSASAVCHPRVVDPPKRLCNERTHPVRSMVRPTQSL